MFRTRGIIFRKTADYYYYYHYHYYFLLTYLPTYLPTHPPTHLPTYLLTYLITYLLTYLVTYSLTHSLTHSLTCLQQLSFHSVAVVLTLVQTKQMRINIHKRNNTKTQYNNTKHSQYKYTYYQNSLTIVKNTHTLQNPHITKPIQLWYSMIYKHQYNRSSR